MKKRFEQDTEIQDMKPVAWKLDGTPTKFEIVQREPDRAIQGWIDDESPIASPIPVERVARVQRVVQSDAVNEARAFNLRVSSLAAVMGGGVVLAALVFGASLSFWSALMWFGTVYALVWAGAFVLDSLTSAGGIEFFHAMRLWAFLDREQAHRHNRLGVPANSGLRRLQTVLLALAVGSTVLAILALVAAVAWEWMPK